MNILRLYYAHVLRITEIFPFLQEKQNEDGLLKKLFHSTIVCYRATATNERNFPIYSHQEAPIQIHSTKFVSFLREIRNSPSFENGSPKIFRFDKLRSSSWKNLHKHLGDIFFRQLLTKFDIFSNVSFLALIQIVGNPLTNRNYPMLGSKRKIDERTDSKFSKRRKLNNSDLVTVKKFLYSKDLRETSKKGNFKLCTKIGCANVNLMIKEIFGIDFLVQLSDKFADILHRYQRNCFRGLLDYHCPIIDNVQNSAMSKLVRCFVPERNVKNYLSSLLTKLIPENLMGKKNLNNFIGKITTRIVEFRRYDADNVRSFYDSFKVKQCLWIHKLTVDHKTKHQIVVSLFRWLLRYVYHLIKKSFYITESQFLKNRILFYRKPIWKEIRKKASLDFIKKCHLKRISRQQSRLSSSDFGPYGFRFVPKYDSVRPILASYDKEPRVYKMNNSLKPTLAILQYVLSTNEDLLGSTAADFESVRDRWKQFIVERRYSSTKILKKPLYFVKADVNSCFDSIFHSVLLEILEEDLKPRMEKFYALQQYTSITFKNEKLFGSHRYFVWPLSEGSNCTNKILNDFISMNRRKMVVVVKDDRPTIFNRDEILNTLKDLINKHVVKVLRKFYIQKQGIAQGSAVSILLCNIYLAKLERRHFGKFICEENLLMRHVDDFLFVTTSKRDAVDFVSSLLNGLNDYNIRSSPRKIVTNFNDDRLNNWFLITDGDIRGVPWCGLLFHPISGEVSTDDGRWLILDVRDIITINYCVNPNEYVKQKLIQYVASRSHSIFFDDDVNSIERIRENISSTFQFLARCYHGFQLSYRCRLNSDEVSSGIARKLISTLCKTSPNLQRMFSINRLAKWFESTLRQ